MNPQEPNSEFIVESPKPTNPQAEQFNSLFSGIKEYNQQFSMGALMAEALRAHISSNDIVSNPDQALADVADSSIVKKLQTKDETAQQMKADVMSFVHQDQLDTLGLGLQPVSGEGAKMFVEGTTIGTGEMRLTIKDQAKFLGFLQGIEGEDNMPEELAQNLQELASILARQVRSADLSDPSDETLKLLSSLGPVTGELKRLGIKEAGVLEKYRDHLRQQNLREYLDIEKGGLFNEPGVGFGPADWQTDANPDFLRRNWTNALNTLKRTRENPNAQELYHELFDKLNNALKIAKADLEQNEKYRPEYRDPLKPILDEVSAEFG